MGKDSKINWLALQMAIVGLLQENNTIYYPTADEAIRYMEGTGNSFLGSGTYESVSQEGRNYYRESAEWQGNNISRQREQISSDEARRFLSEWQRYINTSQKEGRVLNNTLRDNPLRKVI